MPPLLADFIHAGACIPICEKFLTRPSDTPVHRNSLSYKCFARKNEERISKQHKKSVPKFAPSFIFALG